MRETVESPTHSGRTHKDVADVVELIIANRLGSGFARFLHKSVRVMFRPLVTRLRVS